MGKPKFFILKKNIFNSLHQRANQWIYDHLEQKCYNTVAPALICLRFFERIFLHDPSHKDSRTLIYREKIGPVPLWIWMIFFAVLAFLVRMVPVFQFSMWTDDGATLIAIDLSVWELIQQRFSRGHFPWFFILYKYWVQLFGTSILALRLPATLACVATLPFIAGIARRISGKWGIFIASFIYVFHGTLIRHSAEMRMYSWIAFFGAGLIWSALWFLERPNWKRATIWGAFHLCVLQLHVGSILLTIPWFIMLSLILWKVTEDKSWRKGVIGAFFIPLLLALPFYIILVSSVDPYEVEKYIRPQLPFSHLFDVMFRLFMGMDEKGLRYELLLGYSLPLACIAILWWNKKKTSLVEGQPLLPVHIAIWLTLCIWLTPHVAFFLDRCGVRIMGEPRYYIASTAAALGLLGGTAGSLHWEKKRNVIIPNLIFLAIFLSASKHMFYNFKKMMKTKGIALNTMVDEVKEQVPEGITVIISHSRETPFLFKYYIGEEKKNNYQYIEIDRETPRPEITRIISENIDPQENLLLFLYKEKPDNEKVEDIVRNDFGPWKEIIQTKKHQPKWVWLKR
jgi:hypothetical protein